MINAILYLKINEMANKQIDDRIKAGKIPKQSQSKRIYFKQQLK